MPASEPARVTVPDGGQRCFSLFSRILILLVISAGRMSHNGDCACEKGAEGGCCFARCPLPCYVSVPRHTAFCCPRKIQVISTSTSSYGMVEACRLVTAGHVPLTSGLLVRSHASHAQLVISLRLGSLLSQRRPGGPGPTARHVAHGSLACAIAGQSLCLAWRRPASAASLPTCLRCDPEVASLGHGRHGAWPQAGIARAWQARLRGRRATALWGTARPVRPSS
jgi:hypothetical protein